MVKKKRRINVNIKRFLVLIFSIFIIGLASGLFLLYGPFSWFRERLITTAMTTMTHQKFAKWFFDDETIQEVLANNHIIESKEDSNPDLINIDNNNSGNKQYSSKYEKDILEREDGQLYKKIEVSGTGYKGYLIAVYDASKLHIAVSSKVGVSGESLMTLSKNANAKVAINASGFFDPTWQSNGSTPHGTVIRNGKIVWDYHDAGVGGGFIGFNKENKLILGRMSAKQAIAKGIRDAVEFGPFLIVNGKPSFIKGDGGWGFAPRTAIGQRKDGIVLLLVIDGRSATSIGADMIVLTEIMQRYGAVNAANLDGGSSTGLIIENKLINKPTAKSPMGLRKIPTAWVVTE